MTTEMTTEAWLLTADGHRIKLDDTYVQKHMPPSLLFPISRDFCGKFTFDEKLMMVLQEHRYREYLLDGRPATAYIGITPYKIIYWYRERTK